ncbi:MAG: glycogen-binding domain-containing protein [Verrucomicrobia bacterium]|nr:glycogen-binding domain-containing protein [Verrucomicrobiota bacterium]
MNTSTVRQTKKAIEQEFTLHAPEAQAVLLAADFTNWQQRAQPMQRQSDGWWTVTVTLPPGTYHYRFLVDGQWRDDPKCTQRAPNPYGSQNMVRTVSPEPRKGARAAGVTVKGFQARPEWQPVCATHAEAARPRTSAL